MAVTGSTLVTLQNLSYYDSRLKKWVGANLEDSLFAMIDSTTYHAMHELGQTDDKFLYFLTDTGELYKSGICFGRETDLSDYMTATEIAEAISQAIKDFDDGDAVDSKITEALKTYKTSAATEEYVTVTLGSYYTKTEADAAISTAVNSLSTFDKKIVDTLPPNPADNILYLIKDNTATGNDKYKEYLVIDGVLTLIGDTSTDLSDYYTKTQTDNMVKQLATHVGSVDDGTVGCIWIA